MDAQTAMDIGARDARAWIERVERRKSAFLAYETMETWAETVVPLDRIPDWFDGFLEALPQSRVQVIDDGLYLNH